MIQTVQIEQTRHRALTLGDLRRLLDAADRAGAPDTTRLHVRSWRWRGTGRTIAAKIPVDAEPGPVPEEPPVAAWSADIDTK